MSDSPKDLPYFSAGPAKLPIPVLEKARASFFDYDGTGLNVMELSHRGPHFEPIVTKACENARTLLNVPNNYKIMFMHRGGVGQAAVVPLNLLGEQGAAADYCVTGTWSLNAYKECKRYGTPNLVFPQPPRFTTVPPVSEWTRNPNAKYFYYCDNETIHGVEFPELSAFEDPALSHIPVICDASSNIMTRELDVSKYGLIYATVQKNIGASGTTLVILREDLLSKHRLPICPTIMDYQKFADNNSMPNTPSTWSIYVTNLVLEWMIEAGGVAEMKRRADSKAQLLYEVIDESDGYYTKVVDEPYRSRNNVVFRIRDDDKMEDLFAAEAKKVGITAVKGHRSVGGMRASIYSAVSQESVETLAQFMRDFRKNHPA